MNIMSRWFGAVILVIASYFVTQVATADGEGVVEVRQAIMVSISAHMRALGQVAKGNVPITKTSHGHALSIVRMSNVLSLLFPEGSDGKNKHDNHAREEIWSETAEFERKLSDFEKAASRLIIIVENGDQDSIGGALQAVGKTCSGCHNDFREKHTH